MENKTILVTGATGGIGKTLCDYLSSLEYNLIITSRNEENLKKMQENLQKKHNTAIYAVSSDFNDTSTYKRLLDVCSGGIEGLVIMPPKIPPTTDCFASEKEWNDIFRKSFIKPLSLIKNLMPCLLRSKISKVVILSGISSVQVLTNYAVNNAIRAAWVGQAKTMAFSWGKERVHFNTLSLGGVMTESFIKKVEEESAMKNTSYEILLSEKTENVPLNKYATPLEVAVVIEGLLSNFSDHMTGINLICDGGFTRPY